MKKAAGRKTLLFISALLCFSLSARGTQLTFQWQLLSCTDYIFFTDSLPGYNYHWHFGDLHSAQGDSVFHSFPVQGTYIVTLVADSGNFSDSVSLAIYVPNVQPPMSVPNVFTPNDDGIDDEFIITGLVECTPFILSIYDRWGRLLFTTPHPVFVHWNGTDMKGRKVPQGVYYYILFSPGYTTKGILMLFR